jgi:glyoxylase-like metal-dependent hydrolase (beta-lactamase superfamily II)
MTYTGTNSYLVGEGEVVLIDPGPNDPAHRNALLSALSPGERIAMILVTHSHLDHSPLAAPMAEATGAEVLAAGPSSFGRSPLMRRLAEEGALGGGEGVDPSFSPTRPIAEGERLCGPWGEIEVLATPGHMANHLSFAWSGALFSGDLVMGWSTSLVSPPDGDMTAFMASLARLEARSDRIYYPGHGAPVTEPQARCTELITHRRGREAQIRDALHRLGPSTARQLAEAIYTEIAPALIPAAARNVMAHLIDLHSKSEITCAGPLTAESRFAPT